MNSVDGLLSEHDAVTVEVQTMAFLARAPELQEAALGVADDFLRRLGDHKVALVSEGNEAAANLVLAMQLSLRAVRAELSMWLRLKRNDPDGAWDDLVAAQGALSAALSVCRQTNMETGRLESLGRKLALVEHWIFPPQVFMSFGGTVDRRECSICGNDYDFCDHIRGRAYMGQLCHTVIREVKVLSEVSIVTEPADKRCRVTHSSDQGGTRNRMTWRLEEPARVPPNSTMEPTAPKT